MAQEGNQLITGGDDGGARTGVESNDDPNQIKQNIDETRSNMGETIDAIQDKLSLSSITGQVTDHVNQAVETAKNAVYDAAFNKAGNLMRNISNELSQSSVIQKAKDNPIPFALMGLGAGLLIYQATSGKSRRPERRQLSAAPKGGQGNGKKGNSSTESDSASGITGKITGVAGTAYEKVSGIGTAARGQYENYIEESPLAVGAVALALGAAVGMALPSTSYEGELLGPARQQLMDRAQSTASELIDQTKEAVGEAGKSLSDQVKGTSA